MRTPRAISRLANAVKARKRLALRAGIPAACILVIASALLAWRVAHRGHAAAIDHGPHAAIPIAVQPAPRPTTTVTFEQGCLTAACHAPLQAAPAVHAPVAKGICSPCHAADTGGHNYPLRASKPQLCSGCHETAKHQPVQHMALTDDGCLACHSPHGGATRAQLTQKDEPSTCAVCHVPPQGESHHPPYDKGRCDLCHDPHGSSARGLLRSATLSDSCRTCHATVVLASETARHNHGGVEQSCLACHQPHAAPFKGLLAASQTQSCTRCHAEIGRLVADAPVSHHPVLKEERCARCHEPHGSDLAGMLKTDEAQTCLSCHGKSVPTASGRVINAVAAPPIDIPGHNMCSSCHSVHGGSHERLLREANIKTPLGEYDRRNYALCFSCHDARLAELATATQFRDGERNLHKLHLQRDEKSIGCAACHAVHAAGEPRLIARAVNFEGSSWSMPVQFSLTPEGGRCGSGCHEPLEYSRRPGGAKAVKPGGAP